MPAGTLARFVRNFQRSVTSELFLCALSGKDFGFAER